MSSSAGFTRRAFNAGVGAMGAVVATTGCASIAAPVEPDFAGIERDAGGRLGAFLLDTGSGRSVGWRADERFCHCSTFKLSQAAMVLREADMGRIDLAEVLPFSRTDLVAYAPVVEANLAKGGMPVGALAEAVQVTSDNAAANVLMRRLGGPAALTGFWRDIGDDVSRIDGYEPDINVIPPGTQHNSTTPRAMARTVQAMVLGNVLKPASRDVLLGWMAQTRTGLKRIKAGLPADWSALDKTGTGMRPGTGNKTNDLAVLFPPGGRAPIVVIGYFEHPIFSEDVRASDEAALARLGQEAVRWAG